MQRGLQVAALLLPLLRSADAATRHITLNSLEIGLDGENGGIVSLRYPNVGTLLDTESESAGLVDLAFPLADYVPMRLATRFSQATFQEIPGGIAVTWEKLSPSRTHVKLPKGSARVTVTLLAAPDHRSVVMKCRIENGFSRPIPQILFPDFAGLRPAGTPRDTTLTMARGSVRPFTQRAESRHHAALWTVDGGWRVYEATAYSYGPNVMSWLDYGSLKGGFSLFQRKWRDRDYRRPDILTYVSETHPNRMRMASWQPGKIGPGETWESADYWLTPHEGGWAKGIETYREFVHQAQPPRQIPKHIREGLGFLSIWMSDAHETAPEKAAIRFKDVPRIARDVRDHGLDEMSIWRWCFHLEMPIPIRPVLGTVEEWTRGVRESRELGVNIAAALGIHLLHHSRLSRYGVSYTNRNAWNFHRDLIPNFNPSYLKGLPFDHAGQTVPPSNKQWQEDVLSSVSEWIDRGVTSFTWDVFGGGGPDGALSSRDEDNVALNHVVEQFRARARKIDPESTFGAETNSISGLEWDGAVLDYTWNWLSNQVKEGHLTTTDYVEYVEAAPILNVLSAPRVNCNIESSPVALKKCMADGAYINFLLRRPDGENGSAILSEKPELSPVVKQAAARRKQFLTYFTIGAPVGDCILAEPSSLFVRGHVAGNRALIVILNDGAREAYGDLSLNLALWLAAGKHRITRYDADGRVVTSGDIMVAKGSAVPLKQRSLAPAEMEFITIEGR